MSHTCIGRVSTESITYPGLLQGKEDEAESLYRLAMSITERTLSIDHPSYANRLADLAGLLSDQVRARVSLYLSPLVLLEYSKHIDHISTDDLLHPALPQGKYVEAEPLYRKSMCITEKTLGTEHPQYSVTLNNLAELYELQVRIRGLSLDPLDECMPCVNSPRRD